MHEGIPTYSQGLLSFPPPRRQSFAGFPTTTISPILFDLHSAVGQDLK